MSFWVNTEKLNCRANILFKFQRKASLYELFLFVLLVFSCCLVVCFSYSGKKIWHIHLLKLNILMEL